MNKNLNGTRIGSRKVKEQILALRKQGKTLREIKVALTCSYSTVAYHLYTKTRATVRRKTYARRKIGLRRAPVSPKAVLRLKYTQFFRIGWFRKIADVPRFTFEQLWTKISTNPACYLTGRPVNLGDSQAYSLDHKIPLSKGGSNELSNLGLALSAANKAKNSLLQSEFLTLCQDVLEHHGFTITKNKSQSGPPCRHDRDSTTGKGTLFSAPPPVLRSPRK